MVLIIVLVVIVAVRALVCAGAVSDMFVKVSAVVGMGADVLIIVSDVAVHGVRTNMGVDVLVGVNVNVFAGAMTDFEFAMPVPLKVFGC